MQAHLAMQCRHNSVIRCVKDGSGTDTSKGKPGAMPSSFIQRARPKPQLSWLWLLFQRSHIEYGVQTPCTVRAENFVLAGCCLLVATDSIDLGISRVGG
jgi:hypothetical protein